MKGVGSAFIRKVWTAIPTAPRTRMLRATSDQTTSVAWDAKTAAAMKVRTARRAVQGTKGVRSIVRSRAFFDSMIRTPRIAGTLQPKPMHMGMKLLPCSPTRCMNRSMTKAARAM